ncbi:MAG: hypothetical protein KBD01_16720 [Acidobacteria bacterium]|nr:hypothetical protein [Acidobacteriota bacterium]
MKPRLHSLLFPVACAALLAPATLADPQPSLPPAYADLFHHNGGGDGGSPWPTITVGRIDGTMRPQADAGSAGNGTVFTWADWDGSDREIAVARLTPDGTFVERITRNAASDVQPHLLFGPQGQTAVMWLREARGRRTVLAQFLGPDGAGATGAPRVLARLGDGVEAVTAHVDGPGAIVVARAVRRGESVVLEVGTPEDGFVPLAMAPRAAPFEFTFRLVRGRLALLWVEGPELWGAVSRDAAGSWSSPVYIPRTP